MPVNRRYSLWPAVLITVLAVAAPITIGTLEMRIARNAHAETSAIQHLQSVARAENAFRKIHNSFSATLDELGDLPQADASYTFGYRQVSRDFYIATAQPKQPGSPGKRFFFMDQSGVVRYEVMHPAGPTSSEVPPLAK